MWLIFQPTTCGDTQSKSCKHRNQIHFHHKFAKACDQWAETSPTTGNKAKSYPCTKNSSRGCLLGYLGLLGSGCKSKANIEAAGCMNVLGRWSEITVAYCVNVWGSKAIMLWRLLSSIMSLKLMNVHNRKRIVDCLQGLLNCALWPPIYCVALIWKPASIICLLFIYCTIRSMITNIFSSGFHTKPASINQLWFNVLNTKCFSSVQSQQREFSFHRTTAESDKYTELNWWKAWMLKSCWSSNQKLGSWR